MRHLSARYQALTGRAINFFGRGTPKQVIRQAQLAHEGVSFADQAFFTRRAAGCQSSIRLVWEEDAKARQADSSAT